MLSSRQIVDLAIEVERELLKSSTELLDFLPIIRMHLYFSQRAIINNGLDIHHETPGIISRSLFAFASSWRVLVALLVGIPGKQLFLAPANQRNCPSNGRLTSKHLDSLLSRYGGGSDAVWELGPIPAGRGIERSLSCYVTRVSRLIAALRLPTKKLRNVEMIIRRVADASPEDFEWDITALLDVLAVFEVSRRIYVQIFRRSRLSKAYVVCYYGAAQFPILAALNELGAEVIEYQHGVQGDIQPMYTHWEHLPERPLTMPRKILVWDQISNTRISRWACTLGIQVEQVGNLWYVINEYNASPPTDSASILVALQVFPDHFNFEILKAMAALGDREWVFRVHPHSILSDDDRSYLHSRHKNLKIVNPTDESLEESLEKCSICITGFSTVGLEALMCDRKTIFTHANAAMGLIDYFDGERCFFAERSEDIVRLIRNLSPGTP